MSSPGGEVPGAPFEIPVEGEVLWAGRPAVGLRAPDVRASLCAAAATIAVLGCGLAARREWDWGWALPLATGYAAIVGLSVAIARAIGGGALLTLATGFCSTVAVAALATDQGGLGFLCPLSTAAGISALLLLRWRQRVATRYILTKSRGYVGEQGRYLISFPLERAPRLRPDWFGASLGDVEFGRVEAKLRTRTGSVFKVPSHLRRFQRVARPERILEALRPLSLPESPEATGSSPAAP